MNYRMVLYILGKVIGVEGFFLLAPAVCGIIYGQSFLPYFLWAASLCAISLLLCFKKPQQTEIHSRDGFISVALCWIVLSLLGAVPFLLTGEMNSFFDAFFEIVSGFTTTGASVVANVEGLSHASLLWRSLSQWLGGMGVLVFVLAVMPKADMKNARYMHLMRAEVPGPTVDKLVPKIAHTARVMYGIYLGLTVVEVVFLLFGGMDVFEALTHSFSTASTGGFGIKNTSIGGYSPYIQYVIATFMLLFGINLNIFYLLLTGHIFKALKSEEFWWYIGIAATAVVVIMLSIFGQYNGTEGAFRAAYFQVASIMTTSGFSTADFTKWPVLAQAMLVLLMFIGGSTGCTAGGIKVGRVLLLGKNAKREVGYLLHPNLVRSVKVDGRSVAAETIRGTTSFIIVYIIIFVISTLLLIAVESCDLVTGFTTVTTAINNVGPGLASVGPASNFAHFTDFSKLLLCAVMLIGRLEIFPILILFSPSSWRR